jgi:hypothetical protein
LILLLIKVVRLMLLILLPTGELRRLPGDFHSAIPSNDDVAINFTINDLPAIHSHTIDTHTRAEADQIVAAITDQLAASGATVLRVIQPDDAEPYQCEVDELYRELGGA